MQRKLLSRNFVLLWIGGAVSQVGAGAGYIAILWWVQRTTGSALALGSLATVSALTGLVLSPLAGVFVDRWNRKHILVITDIIRGTVNCLLAWAMWQGVLTLPLLYASAAVKSACAQMFSPAVMAAVPQMVDGDQLERANSLQQMTQSLSSMGGYAVGGLLVAGIGIPALLLVNGLAYLLSALSEAFISIEPVTQDTRLDLRTLGGDLMGGLGYVRRDRVLFGVMQVLIIINFALVPFSVLLPKLVADHLRAGSDVLGFISSSQMAGMLVGALLISLPGLVRRNDWVIRWGLSISAMALMLSPLATGPLWPAQMGIYGMSGVVMAMVQIFFFSTLQRKVDPAYMGKVFSLNSAMSLGLQPVAGMLCGYLADIYPLTPIYLGFGSLILLGNVRLLSIPGINEYFGFRAGRLRPLRRGTCAHLHGESIGRGR